MYRGELPFIQGELERQLPELFGVAANQIRGVELILYPDINDGRRGGVVAGRNSGKMGQTHAVKEYKLLGLRFALFHRDRKLLEEAVDSVSKEVCVCVCVCLCI